MLRDEENQGAGNWATDEGGNFDGGTLETTRTRCTSRIPLPIHEQGSDARHPDELLTQRARN